MKLRDLRGLARKLSDNDLLWTCGACGADYTKKEMDRAMWKARDSDVLHYTCTTCGATGQFVDGPDA